jgi:hypothetical protein
MQAVPSILDPTASAETLAALTRLHQHRQDGRRSPHKPLLVLLALGQFATSGSSEVPWSMAEQRLADLIAAFGPTAGPVALSPRPTRSRGSARTGSGHSITTSPWT